MKSYCMERTRKRLVYLLLALLFLFIAFLMGVYSVSRLGEDKSSWDYMDYISLIVGLGVIYTEGLGVPVDMKKGVEYFQKAKNYAPAQEAMLKFKKTLFGKWVRR